MQRDSVQPDVAAFAGCWRLRQYTIASYGGYGVSHRWTTTIPDAHMLLFVEVTEHTAQGRLWEGDGGLEPVARFQFSRTGSPLDLQVERPVGGQGAQGRVTLAERNSVPNGVRFSGPSQSVALRRIERDGEAQLLFLASGTHLELGGVLEKSDCQTATKPAVTRPAVRSLDAILSGE